MKIQWQVRICGSLNLVIFIRFSSGILLRKFSGRIPLVLGRITEPFSRADEDSVGDFEGQVCTFA